MPPSLPRSLVPHTDLWPRTTSHFRVGQPQSRGMHIELTRSAQSLKYHDKFVFGGPRCFARHPGINQMIIWPTKPRYRGSQVPCSDLPVYLPGMNPTARQGVNRVPNKWSGLTY